MLPSASASSTSSDSSIRSMTAAASRSAPSVTAAMVRPSFVVRLAERSSGTTKIGRRATAASGAPPNLQLARRAADDLRVVLLDDFGGFFGAPGFRFAADE